MLCRPIDMSQPFFQKLYFSTFVRGAAFLIGVILGFFLYRKKLQEESNEKIVNSFYQNAWKFFIWLFILFVLTISLHCSIYYEFFGRQILLNALFIGFGRSFWAIAIALLIFMCQNGNGGIINTFSSHTFWTPISKVGLSLYLVHPVLQHNFISSQKHEMNLEIGHMVTKQHFSLDCLFLIFLIFS
jgi:hypothetical protein